MRVTTLLALILFLAIQNTSSQTIEASGEILSDTIWNADTVNLVNDLLIHRNVTLTINPGTVIQAQGNYRITCNGKISAIGNLADTIYFTKADTSHFYVDSTSTAGGWGGIYLKDSNIETDTSIFSFCKFQFGKKYDVYGGDVKGGIICAENYSALRILNSTFKDNIVNCESNGVQGPKGGAIYCRNVNYIEIDSNKFVKNRSFDSGGAIHINENCPHTSITNNYFENNKAWRYKIVGNLVIIGGTGGAISSSDAFNFSPIIANNKCFNNITVNGVIYTSNLMALVHNNLICNNNGSGLFDGHQLSQSKYFNNTIVNNKSRSGGINVFSEASIYNNICWGNLDYSAPEAPQIDIANIGNPMLFNNCVEYGEGGDNAVYDNPRFKDATDGFGVNYNGYQADWELISTSSCINAGTIDTSNLEIPGLDINGNPRIYGERIDIGAYENQTVIYTDIDNSIVNNKYKIYPNPGRDYFKLKTNSKQIVLKVYDINGILLFSKKNIDNYNIIHTKNLPVGTYIVKVFTKDGTYIRTLKWLKN